ncbi:TetR/AcrR family transcriptional regulator [Mycobacterium sp.]|uniref:TetR/AcrR family transcriptional regulator n=1 Tax=Mycobacterium sp. TaxID=1785 RepID=UPI0031E1CEAC
MGNGLRHRKKQATRRAISDAATELFMRNGFDNTTLAQVADAVGVSAQTVLNYFPTKTDLFFDEEDWLAGPPAAIRQRCPHDSPCDAVLGWYIADLRRRHAEGHLQGLADYLATIADSETLRRRRLDDFAALTEALQAALDELQPGRAWEVALTAAVLTSAIDVCETEVARLSTTSTDTENLLDTAEHAATTIFNRVSVITSPRGRHQGDPDPSLAAVMSPAHRSGSAEVTSERR